MFPDKKFKVIVANPPFSIKWEPPKDHTSDPRFAEFPCTAPPSYGDYAFIQHILYKLEDDGVAVIMEFPGILYRKNKEGKIRQYLVENNYVDKVVHIPGNKFEDTSIATIILVLKKNRTTTDIEFIDTEFNLNKTVSFETVKENNFMLSVSSYVEKPDTREKIDINELTKSLHDTSIMDFEKSLLVDLMALSIIGKEEDEKMFLSKIEDYLVLIFAYLDRYKKREFDATPIYVPKYLTNISETLKKKTTSELITHLYSYIRELLFTFDNILFKEKNL